MWCGQMRKWLLNTKRGLPIIWLVVLFLILLFGNVIPRHTALIYLTVALLVLFGGLSIVAIAISARDRHYGRMIAQILLNGVMFVLCSFSLMSMMAFSFDR